MDITAIIQSFSTEDSKLFKAYLRSKNRRSDTKNLTLYNLIRKGTPLKDIDILLYGSPNRNAYHALSKRLQDSLIDFIATQNFENETSDDMQVFKWILAARILYEQDLHKPAQKLLKKATQKAKDLDLHTALIESYHTQFQYSHLHPEVDLQELTQAAQQNQQRFIQQEQLNMAYAHIKRILIFDEHLLKKGIQKTVEEILAAFHIEINETFTFKSLYQLLEIINTAAHLDHNFGEALPFITHTYNLIKKKENVQEKQRFYHIQVLYFMANAHFRVRDFAQATHYLSLMNTEMNAENGKWESRFRENLLLINSFVLNYSGNSSLAIAAIDNHISTSTKKVDPDVLLAQVVFLTQQGEHKAALSMLNKFKHTDSWYEERLGIDWMIKRDLLSLIIYYELEYIDLVHSQLRSFKRKYKKIILSEVRLERFIKVFSQIFNDPTIVKKSNFRESVMSQFTVASLKNEDIFMVSFFAWIKATLDNTKLYETTLALL